LATSTNTKSQLSEKEVKKMNPVGKIPEESNQESIAFLNLLLANEYALFTKTLNFHWNIVGPRFNSLHEFLETQYRSLLDEMDDLAERVRVLGGRPMSTVKEFSQSNSIESGKEANLSADEMISELLRDHMIIQHQIKDALDDDSLLKRDHGTEDFLVGVLKNHEMTSWKLKSLIETQ
jgi:starvation-inducible DNA-binding protein